MTHPHETAPSVSPILQNSTLFSRIPPTELSHLLHCLSSKRQIYAKDETIIHENDMVSHIGIVLRGQGSSSKIDEEGKAVIINLLAPGGFVGLLLAAGQGRPSPVTIHALEETEIIWLPFARIIRSCGHNCNAHEQLVRNCFDSVAEKSLHLLDRIDCLIRPNLRDKILAYLRQLSKQSGSRSIFVPIDRGAMASYVNADRSALSRELSRMKKDGVIDYYQNSFKLL